MNVKNMNDSNRVECIQFLLWLKDTFNTRINKELISLKTTRPKLLKEDVIYGDL